MSSSRKKKRLPSQQKYDQSHPTVSFRLPIGLYHRFKEHLRATKQSPADFVKGHLDIEEAKVKARVEELAGRRDNLRGVLKELERQIDTLNQEIDKRKAGLSRPAEEEKARLQKEVEHWYHQEEARFERSRSYNEVRLDTLRSQVEAEKEKLRRLEAQLIFLGAKKKVIEGEERKFAEERKNWQKQMQWATQMINTYPWLFCRQCPGAWFNQMLSDAINRMTLGFSKDKDDEAGTASSQLPPAQDETKT